MVLSLVDICIRSICHGVETETIRISHLLPLKLRQSILETFLARDNASLSEEWSSKEYLRGFTSLNTQRSKRIDSVYLEDVAATLGLILENGETLGAEIKNLNLNLWVDWYPESGADRQVVETSFRGVVRLIARCSRLRKLNVRLQLRKSVNLGLIWPSNLLLNQVEATEPCRGILENVEELSFTGLWGEGPILINKYPIIELRKLTTLRLVDSSVDDGRWRELLNSAGGTLTHLHLTDVVVSNSDDYFPVPLPHLKVLEIDCIEFRCTPSFVENLKQCSKLEYVFLNLVRYRLGRDLAEDEENLKALSLIAAVAVKIDIRKDSTNGNRILDGDYRFKLVSIFTEKIVHFGLLVDSWDSRTTNAFENAVDVCQNLTAFTFYSRVGHDEIVKFALKKLFGDRDRASKLCQLCLGGDVDFEILSLVSENCANLDFLSISDNANFGDVHLIQWADRGAKPSKLIIDRCINISDNGLIPILVASGANLTRFTVPPGNVTDRTWRILADHCPNIGYVEGIPFNLANEARRKCFDIEFIEDYY